MSATEKTLQAVQEAAANTPRGEYSSSSSSQLLHFQLSLVVSVLGQPLGALLCYSFNQEIFFSL